MSLIALSGRIETDPSEIKNHPNTRLRACLSINTHGVAFACGSSTTMTRCQRRLQTCGHKSASMIDKRTPATWKKMRTSSGEAARPAGAQNPAAFHRQHIGFPPRPRMKQECAPRCAPHLQISAG